MDGFVNDEPSQCGAALACGADRGEGDGAHRQIEIGRLRYHHCVVAAKFEQRPPETCRDDRSHGMAHAAAAGGADEFQARIGRDLLSRFAPANDDLEQSIRHLAESSGGPRQQRLAGERSERRLLRGFPDHRIAAHQRQSPIP